MNFLPILALIIPAAQSAPVPQMSPTVWEADSPYGIIRVYLPRHLDAGKYVSGSVFATPYGSDWNTQHQYFEYLNSLILRLDGHKYKVSDTMFGLKISDDASAIDADVEDSSGSVLTSTVIDCGEPLSSERNTEIAQEGTPIGVHGHFDGDRDDTEVSIDGRRMGVLAESEEECYLTAPLDRQGPIQISVNGNGHPIRTQVDVVSLTFMGPGKPTVSGHTSSIGVEVSGLQGLSQQCFPVLVNISLSRPDVAQFQGSDGASYQLSIWPKDISNGSVLKSIPFRALRPGSYELKADLYPSGQ